MTVKPGIVTLRIPGPEHRARAREIVEATGLFRPEEVEIAEEVFESAALAPGTDYTPLGAFDEEGNLLGFACYGPTPCTVGTWDLYWIAVDPGAHRQGVGRKLAQWTEQRIAGEGGRLIVAETSSRGDYDPTRAFYEALNYEVAARVPDFYAPNDDLVVYIKRLGPPREIAND
ncbi:MAG: GNAT family N-acetyltransferase [Gemmatimonadetes bacterium]|nr:GNAT family N-acetyltransferase [Gemmatimonadota bacterium]